MQNESARVRPKLGHNWPIKLSPNPSQESAPLLAQHLDTCSCDSSLSLSRTTPNSPKVGKTWLGIDRSRLRSTDFAQSRANSVWGLSDVGRMPQILPQSGPNLAQHRPSLGRIRGSWAAIDQSWLTFGEGPQTSAKVGQSLNGFAEIRAEVDRPNVGRVRPMSSEWTEFAPVSTTCYPCRRDLASPIWT